MEKQVQELEIDVSVIIVNYNSTVLLKNCLNSIYEFTKEINYEIIVVDNYSMGGDIEEQLKNYERIKLIKNDVNRGFGTANNQGAENAKGKYLLFLNNDTILFENTIKKIFDFAEASEENNIIGCKLLNEDRSIQKSVFDFPSLLNVFTSNFFLYLLFPRSQYFNKYHLMNKGINKIKKVDVVTGAFLFLERNTFESLNGFDERFFFYMEETDLCIRHRKNHGRVIYYPETAIIHLKGKSAKGESWFKNKYQSLSTIKYFQKHFSRIPYLLAIVFHYAGLLLRVPLFILGGIITFKKNLIKRGFFYIRLMFIYPKNEFKN
jgi:GT2 family glycosyltransferase